MLRLFEVRFEDGKHDPITVLTVSRDADQAIDLAIGSRAKKLPPAWKPGRKDLARVQLMLDGAPVVVSRKSMPAREPVLVIGARAGGWSRPAAKR